MGNNRPETATLQLARDRRLAKRILQGNEESLRHFFNEYFPRLYRYARHRLRSEADVDDVVQAALAQAARRLETYRGEATLLTWLVQICRHEISRHLQAQDRHRDMMTPFLNDEMLRAVVESIEDDGGSDPESESSRMELISLIQFSLDQLPERYAIALEMKYVHGFDSKEIAEHLAISDAATQSLLARARRAFRDVCHEALHAAI